MCIRDSLEILLGQHLRARHQLDMGIPELLRGHCALDEGRGAQRDVAAGQGPMAEDVAQALTELVADFDDAFIGCAAIGAGIAAIFDQRDLRAFGAKGVIDLSLIHI